MKYMIKIFWLFCAFSMLTLMANRSGRGALTGEALTLAPGEGGRTCSNTGCHGSASPFGTELILNMFDADGSSVSSYEPGETYWIGMDISATGATGYGFMMVCLDGNDQAINNWGDLPSNQIRNINLLGRDYLEHTTRLSENNWEFEWTAPAAGTGDVIFYAAGNAVNGNNSNSGDDANVNSRTFTENITSKVDDVKRESILVYPNPVKDQLRIISSGNYSLQIFNAFGIQVKQMQSKTNEDLNIDLSRYAQGTYVIRILDNESRLIETKRIVKVD